MVTFKKVLSRMSDGSACKDVSLEVLGPEFDPQNPRGNIKSQVQWHTLIDPVQGRQRKVDLGGLWACQSGFLDELLARETSFLRKKKVFGSWGEHHQPS